MVIEDLLQPKEKKGAIFLGEFDSFFNLTPNHIKKKKKSPRKSHCRIRCMGLFIYIFLRRKRMDLEKKIKTNGHDCNTYIKAKSPKTCYQAEYVSSSSSYVSKL